MKRDLVLIKKILLEIEDKYENTVLMNLPIEGYTLSQIANHCELLYGEGLISKYAPHYGSNQILFFTVGNLTNEGFNYLDSIRNTDDLDSHKSFVVNVDNSTNVSAETIKRVGVIGNGNVMSADKSTETSITTTVNTEKKDGCWLARLFKRKK